MTQPVITPHASAIQQQLEQLKDIHLPEPISWWPLALGWWVLLALIVLTLFVWAVRHYRRRHRRRVYRAALAELAALAALPQEHAAQQAQALSALLKRVGVYCGSHIETLTGQVWATYLMQQGFHEEQADFIAFASYAKADAYTVPEWHGLQAKVRCWMKKQFK